MPQARPSRTVQPRALSRFRSALLAVEALEDRCVLSATTATYYHLAQPLDGGATPYGSQGPVGLTPAQIRHAYGFDAISFGTVVGDGTGQTIAIIDAYDDPRFVDSTNAGFANSDLHKFDAAFGLADPPSFRKVNQSGGTAMPTADAGWAGEIALDVEWAHALAPGASILLVEANSASYTDLFAAINWAKAQPGVSVVSMSWGGGEFSSETSYDSYFTTPAGHQGVTFLASTGDSGAPAGYPAYSPRVVAVGGTRLNLGSGNVYGSESGWSGGGGGISSYEAQPTYQAGVVTQSTTRRTAPDVAFDADPNSGVAVYDSYNGGSTGPWFQVGGTSFSAPAWGALIAVANQGRVLAGQGTLDGFSQTLPKLYALPGTDFHDVTSGNNGYAAGTGYDLVTGRGTPYADRVARDLQDGTATTGLRITSFTATTSSVTVTFNKAVNPTTFTSSDVAFTGPAGAITVTGVTPVTGSNNTRFTVTFATQSTPGTYTMVIGPDVRDTAGLAMDQNGNGVAGETADKYTAQFYVTTTQTYNAGGLPLAITDNHTTIASVTVPGDFLITKLTVKLNVTHTWDSDLYIHLRSPSGTDVVLANRRGSSGDNYTNTIFDDAAATAISAGAAPFAGTYRPDGSLAVFNNRNARGTWQLWVEDRAAGDVGTLNTFALILQGVPGNASGAPAARPSAADAVTAALVPPSLPQPRVFQFQNGQVVSQPAERKELPAAGGTVAVAQSPVPARWAAAVSKAADTLVDTLSGFHLADLAAWAQGK